jgi:hypothetical protein
MSEPAPLLDRKSIEEAFRRLGDRLANAVTPSTSDGRTRSGRS